MEQTDLTPEDQAQILQLVANKVRAGYIEIEKFDIQSVDQQPGKVLMEVFWY